MNKRVVFIGAALAATLALGIAGYQWYQNHSMVAVTLEWARLAPFPDGATEFTITTSGGMFSREFHVVFVAPPEEIAAWLKASPGIQDAEIEEQDNSVLYKIKPGGGAQRAEVEHNPHTNRITVHVVWS